MLNCYTLKLALIHARYFVEMNKLYFNYVTQFAITLLFVLYIYRTQL